MLRVFKIGISNSATDDLVNARVYDMIDRSERLEHLCVAALVSHVADFSLKIGVVDLS